VSKRHLNRQGVVRPAGARRGHGPDYFGCVRENPAGSKAMLRRGVSRLREPQGTIKPDRARSDGPDWSWPRGQIQPSQRWHEQKKERGSGRNAALTIWSVAALMEGSGLGCFSRPCLELRWPVMWTGQGPHL